MINKELYIGTSTPKSNEVVWIRPLKDGGVALYAYVYSKWQVLKLVNGKGTLPVDDDEVIDPATPGGNYYTKNEIDERFADILGLDAEGIAELKALIEDGDALTGLLAEIEGKANVVRLSDYTRVSPPKALPTRCIYKSGDDYLLPKRVIYQYDSYLIFRHPGDNEGDTFHYIVFKYQVKDEVYGYYHETSYLPVQEPPAWVEDAFGYTRSEVDAKIKPIEDSLKQLSAEYDMSDNVQHKQSPNMLFNTWDATALVGEENEYWTWPSEVGSQTFYIRWNAGQYMGNQVYVKKGTVNMKLVTYVDRRINNYPDLLIRWGTETSYHIEGQWPYGDETIYTSEGYQEVGTWVVRNITFEVPADGYIWCFGNCPSTGINSMLPVLYASLEQDDDGLINVKDALSNLTSAVDAIDKQKVNKEQDKGLSTNDYTDIDKQAVTSLPQTYESKLTFVTLSSNTVTAVSNTYCRLTNNPYSSVSMTLPTNPNYGDICVFNFITNSSFNDITWYNGTVKTMKDYTIEKSARNEVTALYDGSGYWLITAVAFAI